MELGKPEKPSKALEKNKKSLVPARNRITIPQSSRPRPTHYTDWTVPAKQYMCYLTQCSWGWTALHGQQFETIIIVEQERKDQLSSANQILFRTINRDWPPMKCLKQDHLFVKVSSFIRNQSSTSVIFWFCTIWIASFRSGVATTVRRRITKLHLPLSETHWSALRQRLKQKLKACRVTYKGRANKNTKLLWRQYLFFFSFIF
jgi:hypothetical protein